MNGEPKYLLDASALLAWIFREPGNDVVDGVLADCAISAVNLAEVVTKLVKRSGDEATVVSMVRNLGLTVLVWDEQAALQSAQVAALADQGLSLGDRACISEALRFRKTKVVTADREWKKVAHLSARVVLIR